MAAHHRPLAIRAEISPENFEHRAALVGAELARVEGREFEALRLYERAIHAARASGFVHHEALGHELAGRFYLQRGFETAGAAHLGHARACYALWGADGKVRQLDALYPHLREAETGARRAWHHRSADRAPGAHHRAQRLAGRLGRARAGQARRDPVADGDRARRRRTGRVDRAAGRGALDSGRREHQRQRHPDRAPRRAVRRCGTAGVRRSVRGACARTRQPR